MELKINQLTKAVLVCLFTALISIGAYIAVPIPGSPVPIVLQNMFIMIAALMLGPWWSLLAVVFYLLFGMIGMPVFAGGTGGLVKFVGPTGGYLIGYIPATVVMGIVAQKGRRSIPANLLACFLGMIIVDAFGIVRLKAVLDVDWTRALVAGFYPFILGDVVKIVLASILAPRLFSGIEGLVNRGTDA